MTRNPWLTYGCFGCLAMVGFVVMLVVGVVGVAYLQVGEEILREETLEPELPAFAVPLGSPELAPEATADRQPEGIPTAPLGVLDRAGGRVVLDVGQAGLSVKPAAPGERLRVEARYDEESYRLEESLEPADEESWTYSLTFRRTRGSTWMGALKELLGGLKPEVVVYLPPDTLLDLEATASQGALEMELGGLWLKSAVVDVQQGGSAVVFSRPLRQPMEHLDLKASMGGFAAMGLGHASPARLDVNFSMGGMFLGMKGRWLNDSEIHLDASMGGGQVQLPDGVHVEGVPSLAGGASPSEEIPRPTLRFHVSEAALESLEFSR